MIKSINLGEKNETIDALTVFKNENKTPRFIRIINSNIKELNNVIGRKVFKKDALYINSQTLYEIMQDDGEKGSHHHHGLTPEQVYNALSRLQYSKDVIASYDDRYVVITDVIVSEEVKLIVIVSSDVTVVTQDLKSVITIITIYPSDKDKSKKKK